MGFMKQEYTKRMLKAKPPVEMPDVVALPRCKCGSRRWTLDLTFGLGNAKRARGHVDAQCTQCGKGHRVHEYKGTQAYEAAFGLRAG